MDATNERTDERTGRRGRPRSFDRDAALRAATIEFWERGYEAVSIADLTRVMHIKAPSLYAAFGDKKTLFEEAVEAYVQEFGGYLAPALTEEPTARRGVARLLREAAASHTLPGHPRGCMIITAATNCTPQSAEVLQGLKGRRNHTIELIERRIRADVAVGELPADTDAHLLAVYCAAVLQGMSQQARDGAARETLEAVAELSMRAWPHPPAADGADHAARAETATAGRSSAERRAPVDRG
ncbi:TetR/AcrR family transcriptional regulator [Streptomyces sp. SAJ15]|uniref:TetR/AcrR family transcriptional regulator n=1 Tax=Streptomyces sp. SAJ15 TaxID=2011095 RepID=UPI001185FC3B|nr:TetR/AcrR family transcriptional regulator [Streptomyces sp. SAJ15]TVL94061.1 TetR family transcriptional regulator [Streptomyces sp. SAJ15]